MLDHLLRKKDKYNSFNQNNMFSLLYSLFRNSRKIARPPVKKQRTMQFSQPKQHILFAILALQEFTENCTTTYQETKNNAIQSTKTTCSLRCTRSLGLTDGYSHGCKDGRLYRLTDGQHVGRTDGRLQGLMDGHSHGLMDGRRFGVRTYG